MQDTVKLCKKNKKKSGVIIEGETLGLIFSDEDMLAIFYWIAVNSAAVVCCRSTPKWKLKLYFIKGEKNMAIGDGANDVNMIEACWDRDFWKWRNACCKASDFALRRLVFLHGRWNYIRISEMIMYFFYKNILFTIPYAWSG